jgi:predicted kinase
MNNFRVKVGSSRSVAVPPRDAVRLGNDVVLDMANRLIGDIRESRDDLVRELSDPDAVRQYFVCSGDVMVKALVSRSGDDSDLQIELYICQIERYARFAI